MKRLLYILLAVCMVFTLTSCWGDKLPTETPPPEQTQGITPNVPPAENEQQRTDSPEPPEQPFEGKIAIILSYTEVEYRSAESIIEKYGEDKIVHKTWPVDWMQNQPRMIELVAELAADTEIKALIINETLKGTNAAVDKLLETRNDMFIVYYDPREIPFEASKRANLVLMMDNLLMGPAMVEKAHNMGAKTFVHYSFPRHIAMPVIAQRIELIKQKCSERGIKYVDVDVLDPVDVGTPDAQQYILEDVPKQVAKYGKDTAFFVTNCAMQIPLIKMVMETGAIYPQPCCPSPYHGFTTAIGIESTTEVDGELRMRDADEIIADTKNAVAEKNMTGRLSTWSVLDDFVGVYAGTEYAIKWLNGDVSKEGIDTDVLVQIMNEYTGVECSVRPFEEDGVVYPNFLLFLEGYITY